MLAHLKKEGSRTSSMTKRTNTLWGLLYRTQVSLGSGLWVGGAVVVGVGVCDIVANNIGVWPLGR